MSTLGLFETACLCNQKADSLNLNAVGAVLSLSGEEVRAARPGRSIP